MPEASDEPTVEETQASRWNGWFSGRLPLETETAVFILVNVLDVFLTVALVYYLNTHGEGNPFANYFLNRWGFQGLVYYKMSMVAFVCVIAQMVARRNVKVARRLLYGLIAIVSAVVVYSGYLITNAL